MWPFKKSKTEIKTQIITTSVLCIPGNWENWDEFILQLVAATNGEYFAAGNVLMNPKTDRYYTVYFSQHDHKMRAAFKYAGMATNIPEDTLIQIEKHKSVIYITGETGNLSSAEHISYAGSAILKAGGLGVKVETAGKAFAKESWVSLTDNFEESNLYKMFVIDSITKENGTVFSCGMHNLGFRDTIISGLEIQSAIELISIFSYYQIVDKPIIQNMQTFGVSLEAPTYRISEELNQPYQGNELFGNPYGMWRLTQE